MKIQKAATFVGTLFVLLAIVTTIAPAAGASTPTRTHVHITHSTIRLGSTAKVYGYVSPNLHGHRIYLQLHSSTGWHSLKYQALGPHSHYGFTVRPRSTGARYYRVYNPRARYGRLASWSRVVALHIRAKSSSSNCTPGYSPCITPGSDVDCAGGSGNGPRYRNGPIYVTGSDPYGLDADGDGVACES